MKASLELSNGQEVVIFHSALGLRPAVLSFAARLREAGHRVHTPDLYDGAVFMNAAAAVAKIQELGFDELIARSQAAVTLLPSDLVYAGFSNGGAFAELLAATRPGARAAILMHAPLMIRDLGWKTWPHGVPVQVHFSERDPLRSQPIVEALAARVRASGATFEQVEYRGSGHLFADMDSPDYSPTAAEAMVKNILQFLNRLA
jgi:dienelactone hydrolase